VSAERVIANLLRIAREDLEGARMLNTRGNRNAIYLCEQVAEWRKSGNYPANFHRLIKDWPVSRQKLAR
jgi:hypothetical protein